MRAYTITRVNDRTCQHRAESPDQAAARHARYCISRVATTWRTTGTAGLSGYFQAYRPARQPGRPTSSTGQPFHVREEN